MSREALSKIPFEELLQRARTGDALAREELFRRCQQQVGKWASRRPSSPPPDGARPSDIVQNVTMLAARGLPQFKGNTEREWYAWVKEIYGNHRKQALRDALRQKRAAPDTLSLNSDEAAEEPSPETSPSQFTAHQEEALRLYACIYNLPDDQRQAITLCHLQELPVAEAARQMERTEKSVAGLLFRGWEQVKERMRAELRPSSEEAPSAPPLRAAETALLAWLRRRSAGEVVDPAAFVAEHPECADELRDMLHWIERLQSLRPKSSKK